MKRRIVTIVLLCCALLIAVGGTAAADPPDRVIGSGHAWLTTVGTGGGDVGTWQIDFRFRAWEATDSRPAGGWGYLKIMDAEGNVLAEYRRLTYTYVNIENGRAAMGGYNSYLDQWTYQVLADLGSGARGQRDEIRPGYVGPDETTVADLVQTMPIPIPERTWTLDRGNIQIIE